MLCGLKVAIDLSFFLLTWHFVGTTFAPTSIGLVLGDFVLFLTFPMMVPSIAIREILDYCIQGTDFEENRNQKQ